MELDWCVEEDVKNTQLFNDNSVISSKTKMPSTNIVDEAEIEKDLVDITECFNININCSNSNDLLNVLHYLSDVSNHLRTLIRSKGSKNFESNINYISQNEFDSIIKYQQWLVKASINIKNYFSSPQRKDNSFDPGSIKPFKTSSYKFCNFKESCSIHKNKNRTCDKNHFVFDMIINDISKLSESLISLGIENLNHVLENKNIKMTWNAQDNTYSIDKKNNITIQTPETEFIIDKILIFKSFDVSSYVLNKMYEESIYFLKYNIKSLQINI
jgi:hypothetical protein